MEPRPALAGKTLSKIGCGQVREQVRSYGQVYPYSQLPRKKNPPLRPTRNGGESEPVWALSVTSTYFGVTAVVWLQCGCFAFAGFAESDLCVSTADRHRP